MEHSNPKTQRAIELYNDVQEKKKALKDAKKAFMEVHVKAVNKSVVLYMNRCNH